MDLAAILASAPSFARAILRAPVVHLRLLIETPALWAPAFGAGLLIGAAWLQERRGPTRSRSALVTEAVTCAFGVTILAWLFHAGQFPWTEEDWGEEWIFFTAWKQALHDGRMPYYLGTAMQGTERYLANLQTPMMPYVFGLSFLSVNTFVLAHVAVVSSAGFLGAVALRRELALGLLPWLLFVVIFAINGHIVSHLSVGHLPWVAYFLTPWMLVSAVRVAHGDESLRNVATCAAAFAGMILIGGWHVFVWSWLFMSATCLTRPRWMLVLAQIGVLTALLAAVRLAPAIATFGLGANFFVSGFPSLASLLAALVGTPVRYELLDQWELDAFVGVAGFILLCLGAVPFRDMSKRFLNVLLLPSAALILLSLGNVYGETLFRLPGFVSERVTTRLIILPVLWLSLAGAVRIDTWWRRPKSSSTIAIPVVMGASFLALQLLLRAQAWRPHAGSTLDLLPVEVLKDMPAEPLYFWAFWCGAAISLATAIAVARMLFWPAADTRTADYDAASRLIAAIDGASREVRRD